VVAAPGPGRRVRRREHGVDLVAVEEADGRVIVAFGRDGKDAGDECRMLGNVQRRVAEQRVDRGQPGVAGGDTVVAAGLQMG
jgi:hypothetical protein